MNSVFPNCVGLKYSNRSVSRKIKSCSYKIAGKLKRIINFLHEISEYNGKLKIMQQFLVSIGNRETKRSCQRQSFQTGSTGQGKSGRQPTSTGDSPGA